MTDPTAITIDTYRRHVAAFNRDRDRSLFERSWLDRFLAAMPEGRRVLDIGCGMGEPIARYLIDKECQVTGVDTSPGMLDLCRSRYPEHEWIEADMRTLDLGRSFDGLIAFDSFFFLTWAEQPEMFPVFAAHAAPGAPLLFTSGPEYGEAFSIFEGEPVHHASLAPETYRELLDGNGFDVIDFVPEDPDCNGHSVWLAKRRYDPAS
ncbi:MAG: class I SAM-dependent methyltransferase [Minwuia sp.]|uniref:class I SAM-dependent methyltransferase n=1 Tax=Minwuia sp. TaxID=2493630 RepID=UPI003A864C9A